MLWVSVMIDVFFTGYLFYFHHIEVFCSAISYGVQRQIWDQNICIPICAGEHFKIVFVATFKDMIVDDGITRKYIIHKFWNVSE